MTFDRFKGTIEKTFEFEPYVTSENFNLFIEICSEYDCLSSFSNDKKTVSAVFENWDKYMGFLDFLGEKLNAN